MTWRGSLPKKPRTLLDICVARLGVHRGALAAAWLIEYAWATQDLGHVPTAVEYAEWALVDERTAWRRRAALRTVFGHDEWRHVVSRLSKYPDLERERSTRRLVGLPIPA